MAARRKCHVLGGELWPSFTLPGAELPAAPSLQSSSPTGLQQGLSTTPEAGTDPDQLLKSKAAGLTGAVLSHQSISRAEVLLLGLAPY